MIRRPPLAQALPSAPRLGPSAMAVQWVMQLHFKEDGTFGHSMVPVEVGLPHGNPVSGSDLALELEGDALMKRWEQAMCEDREKHAAAMAEKFRRLKAMAKPRRLSRKQPRPAWAHPDRLARIADRAAAHKWRQRARWEPGRASLKRKETRWRLRERRGMAAEDRDVQEP